MSVPSSEVVLAPVPTEPELNKSVGVPESSSLSSSTPTPNPENPSEAAPVVSDKQRLEELEKINKKHEQRIKDLELALAESRKLVRDRETLLTQVQWKPKDDFYVWKNPKINDKQVRDAMEKRLQTLMDQMRVMEKVLLERDQEIEVLYGQLNGAMMVEGMEGVSSPVLGHSLGSSGTFASPMQSPRIVNPSAAKSPQMHPAYANMPHNAWMRSPMASPMTSPVTSPSQPKKRWWNFGSNPSSRRSSLSDSSGRVPCPPAHMVPSGHMVPSPQVRSTPVTMVNV